MTCVPRARVAAIVVALLVSVAACDSDEMVPPVDRNDLASMPTVRLTIEGHVFEVWVARTTREQRLGLMHVEADELAPTEDWATRGMLFVNDSEQLLAFWMKDTPTALDIAYLRADGTIAKIHTMPAFDTSLYSSGEPVQYALEVLAGTFIELGISEGDLAVLPL